MQFFNNLKVAIKIGIGFGLILLLLAMVGGLGINTASKTKGNVLTYRGLARDSNLAGRLQANFLLTRIGVRGYMSEKSEKALTTYNTRISQTNDLLANAKEEIQAPKRVKLVKQIDDGLAKYQKLMSDLVALRATRSDSVKEVENDFIVMHNSLEELSSQVTDREQYDAASYVHKLTEQLLELKILNNILFYRARTEQDATNAIAELDLLVATHSTIPLHLFLPAERETLEMLGKTLKEVRSDNMQLAQTSVKEAEIINSLNSLGSSVADLMEECKLSIMTDQDTLGPIMQTNLEEAETNITTISGFTLLFGVLLAFLISRTITVPLKKASVYTEFVARGDLEQKLDVNQKDEVGIICSGIEKVVGALKKMKSEFDGVVTGIGEGRLSERGNSGQFEGSFAELITGVNRLSDVLVGFIEAVPMPITTLDGKMQLLYLNNAGRQWLGADLNAIRGKHYNELMHPESGDVAKGPLGKAYRDGSSLSESDVLHPAGKTFLVDTIGVPVTMNGARVGVLGVIVDQTSARTAQQKMLQVAEQADNLSGQLASAGEQLAAQVEQASRGAQVQSERISTTASAMEQMNASVIEVAQSASHASSSADEAKKQAEEGAQVVTGTIKAITEVHELTDQLKSNMVSLGEQAESIGQVMNVISDIADQTNLLALNAAIEAARAGDAGRGFAVVADEVRKLAEKTMSATHEVGKNIGAIQEAAQLNIQSMEKAAQAVEHSTELASKSGESLKGIVQLVQSSASQVVSIATAAEEQSAASEEINRSIEEVNISIQETSEGMVQAAAAVEELAVMSNELSELIAGLRRGND